MQELYKSGMTYAEIGERFGISKQRVHHLIGEKQEKFFRPITEERCIYDGLRKWMNDNKVCVAELTRRLYGCYSPDSYQRIKAKIRGDTELTKTYIDKILELTDLTYEEAFKRSDNNGE